MQRMVDALSDAKLESETESLTKFYESVRVRAGVGYVMVSMASSLIFVLALAYVYAAVGTMNMAQIGMRKLLPQEFARFGWFFLVQRRDPKGFLEWLNLHNKGRKEDVRGPGAGGRAADLLMRTAE